MREHISRTAFMGSLLGLLACASSPESTNGTTAAPSEPPSSCEQPLRLDADGSFAGDTRAQNEGELDASGCVERDSKGAFHAVQLTERSRVRAVVDATFAASLTIFATDETAGCGRPLRCTNRGIDTAPSDPMVNVVLDPGAYLLQVAGGTVAMSAEQASAVGGVSAGSTVYEGAYRLSVDIEPAPPIAEVCASLEPLEAGEWQVGSTANGMDDFVAKGMEEYPSAPDAAWTLSLDRPRKVRLLGADVSNGGEPDIFLLRGCGADAEHVDADPDQLAEGVALEPGTYSVVLEYAPGEEPMVGRGFEIRLDLADEGRPFEVSLESALESRDR